MKISFHGACDGVTGSCHLVDTGTTKFLVDCGLFQGNQFAEKNNYADFGFNPKDVDFVILTHAHLDHCGRLPKLYNQGFSGPIYSTAPTRDFTEIILRDSARIIFEEARQQQHEPLYLDRHIGPTMKNFKILKYHQPKKVAKDVSFEFYDAGHILGSAFVDIIVNHSGKKERLVFSGDLGNPPVPLLKPTEFVSGADYVILESTYGGRTHEPSKERHNKLRDILTSTINRGGVLMIPTFALERTQELLYELNHLVENREVPLVPVYVDSPLAIKATDIYKKYQNLYNNESQKLISTGDDIFYFPKLRYTKTSHQSKEINKNDDAKIIIAGSGMANGGRILFHLKKYLSQKKNQLLIIGYQAEGTLGRKLLDGYSPVDILDSPVKVKANIQAIGAYSAHADQPKLINWVKKISKPKPKSIFLVHGETESKIALAKKIKNSLKLSCVIPDCHQDFDL